MKKSLYQNIEDVSEQLVKHSKMFEEQEEMQAMSLLNQVIIQDQLAGIESAQAEMLLQSIEGGG